MDFELKVSRGRSGLWFIDSPQFRGLLVAERTIEQALAKLPIVAADIIKAFELSESDGTLTARGAEQLAAYRQVFAAPADSVAA